MHTIKQLTWQQQLQEQIIESIKLKFHDWNDQKLQTLKDICQKRQNLFDSLHIGRLEEVIYR